MSATLFALVERVHGHVAVLALALLLHPVITLRTRRLLTPWTVRTSELAALLLSGAFAVGWWLYPSYRAEVKPALLADLPRVAASFETKEHLAFCAAALAIAGAVVLRRAGASSEGRKAAWALLVGAWICGVTTGALGVFVASFAQTGW
ncbi:MAG: hypothetical protein KDA24_24880 [Deltaproteobacteria bacterium]|nr:hypothetical protein [Deltaproteobacteria bacterium]